MVPGSVHVLLEVEVQPAVDTEHAQLIGKDGEEDGLLGKLAVDDVLQLVLVEALAVDGQQLVDDFLSRRVGEVHM